MENCRQCDRHLENTRLHEGQWRNLGYVTDIVINGKNCGAKKLGGVTDIWRTIGGVMDIRKKMGGVTDIRKKLGGVTDIWRILGGVTDIWRKLGGVSDIWRKQVV